MKTLDLFFIYLLASAPAALYYLGHSAWAIYAAGVFLIILANLVIHYLSQPLPRWIIGASLLPEGELEKIKAAPVPAENVVK